MEKEYHPHLCGVCGKRFKHGNQLRQHTMIHLPPDQPPYKCENCERTFTRSHHLKLHRISHTGQKLFYCDFCIRKFNQASRLRYHMMVHEQSKQRPCPVCGRNFVREKDLKEHMNEHLPKETCPLCKKPLLRKNLEQHIKLHGDRKTVFCSICHLSVPKDNYETHLANHKRRLNEEHVCSTCGRKFLHLGNYENHLITHSGYIPYICKQCGRGFLKEGSYKRHMKLHGNMESQPLKEIEKRKENKIPTKSLKPSDLSILSDRSNRCQQNDFGLHTNDYISGPLKPTSGKRPVVRDHAKSMPPMEVKKGHEYEMDLKSSGFPTSDQSNRYLQDDVSPRNSDYHIRGLLKSTTGERHVVHEKGMPPMKDEEAHVNEIASKSEFSTFEFPSVLSGQLNAYSHNDFSPHTSFLKSTSGKGHVVYGHTESMSTMKVAEENENEIASKSSESFPSDFLFAGVSQYSYQNNMEVFQNTEMVSPSEMEEIALSYHTL